MNGPVNDWDTLQTMLDEWLDKGNAYSVKERQALIPIRNFIWDRTTEGKEVWERGKSS